MKTHTLERSNHITREARYTNSRREPRWAHKNVILQNAATSLQPPTATPLQQPSRLKYKSRASSIRKLDQPSAKIYHLYEAPPVMPETLHYLAIVHTRSNQSSSRQSRSTKKDLKVKTPKYQHSKAKTNLEKTKNAIRKMKEKPNTRANRGGI